MFRTAPRRARNQGSEVSGETCKAGMIRSITGRLEIALRSCRLTSIAMYGVLVLFPRRNSVLDHSTIILSVRRLNINLTHPLLPDISSGLSSVQFGLFETSQRCRVKSLSHFRRKIQRISKREHNETS